MAYATVAEVQSEFKRVVFTGTNPAVITAEVTEFLDETSAEIDVILGTRYETPITGTNALLVIKHICIDFVAYRVAKILEIKKNIPVPDTKIVTDITEGTAFKISKDKLEKIQKGLIVLSDAVLAATDSGMSSYTSNVANAITPVFKKDEQQW